MSLLAVQSCIWPVGWASWLSAFPHCTLFIYLSPILRSEAKDLNSMGGCHSVGDTCLTCSRAWVQCQHNKQTKFIYNFVRRLHHIYFQLWKGQWVFPHESVYTRFIAILFKITKKWKQVKFSWNYEWKPANHCHLWAAGGTARPQPFPMSQCHL